MKRNEAIDLIAGTLGNLMGDINFNPYLVAEVILDNLETSGFQPPAWLLQDGDLGSKFVKGWEPDEKI
jgi:hypothetical protein